MFKIFNRISKEEKLIKELNLGRNTFYTKTGKYPTHVLLTPYQITLYEKTLFPQIRFTTHDGHWMFRDMIICPASLGPIFTIFP